MVGEKILVVEDEIIVAKNIQNLLESLGYNVPSVVSSGEEAVKKTEETHPDLVLMDIKLEGDIDGIEAANQIRSSLNVPIVYLTAYADDEILRRARITEPYGYIIKPFEERELQSNIEIALYKHKMENKLRESKEHLQNIINSTSEIIISFDKNNRVTTWNKSAELITGYKRKEVIWRHIAKLDVFDNPQELLDDIESIYNKKIIGFDNLILRGKNGAKRIIKVSCSPVMGDKGQGIGVLFVGTDITRDFESHGRLLKGCSYLILDKDNRSALDLFITLGKYDHDCLFITRDTPEIINGMTSLKDCKVVLLSRKKLGEFENISNFKGLITKIKEFTEDNPDSVILLDGVHYFLTRFPFEKFTDTLYRVREIVSDAKSMLLLHLDPSLLDERQIAVIENEFQLLPSQKIDNVELRDELFDILLFIDKQNQNKSEVSFKKISKRFSLVTKTTSKRLKNLENRGLIFIKKRGRSKLLHVSQKGKTLLCKRQMV